MTEIPESGSYTGEQYALEITPEAHILVRVLYSLAFLDLYNEVEGVYEERPRTVTSRINPWLHSARRQSPSAEILAQTLENVSAEELLTRIERLRQHSENEGDTHMVENVNKAKLWIVYLRDQGKI